MKPPLTSDLPDSCLHVCNVPKSRSTRCAFEQVSLDFGRIRNFKLAEPVFVQPDPGDGARGFRGFHVGTLAFMQWRMRSIAR